MLKQAFVPAWNLECWTLERYVESGWFPATEISFVSLLTLFWYVLIWFSKIRCKIRICGSLRYFIKPSGERVRLLLPKICNLSYDVLLADVCWDVLGCVVLVFKRTFTHVCLDVYMYIRVRIYTYIYTHLHIYIYICTYIYTWAYTYIHIYIYIRLHMYSLPIQAFWSEVDFTVISHFVKACLWLLER